MHDVWRDLGLMQHRVENMSSMWQEIAMIRARLVPGKHGMVALMIALKEAEIKTEAISVHMHQRQTETKDLDDKGRIWFMWDV